MSSRSGWALFAGGVALAVLAIPALAVAHPPKCPETYNPAGQPDKFLGVPAGTSTAPGTETNGPLNPDGFFRITSDAGAFTLRDGCGCVGFGGVLQEGGGSCFVYGTFTSPITIKYTEANGKDAAIEPMAGSKQPGSPAGDSSDFIQYHLWGQGDLEVCNSVGCTCCPVPPPPF